MSKKVFFKLFVFVIVLAFILPFIFFVAEFRHDCGAYECESCEICSVIQTCKKLLSSAALCGLALTAARFKKVFVISSNRLEFKTEKSPIILKVKLLN